MANCAVAHLLLESRPLLNLLDQAISWFGLVGVACRVLARWLIVLGQLLLEFCPPFHLAGLRCILVWAGQRCLPGHLRNG